MADEKDDPPSATAQMPRVRRRAPTIDLKATEVAVEQPAAAADPAAPTEPEHPVPPEYSTVPPDYETAQAASPPPPPPEPPRPPHQPAQRNFARRPAIEAGLVGGLVALAVCFALWLGGMFSGTDESLSDQRLASIEARLRELANRPAAPAPDTRPLQELAARIGRLENAPRPPATVSAAGAEEAIKPLQGAIADLTRRVEDNATAVRDARGQADAAVVAADAARVAAERSNVDALTNRIAALESAAKTLSGEVAKSLADSGDKPLRAAVAAQALQSVVERGDPFAAELAAAKAVAPNTQILAPLEPFAASGLPSAAALARQLSELAPAMQKSVAPRESTGGFLDRLQANAERLVRIRPIDEAPGDDPAAVISRAEAKAARSDLTGAVAELKALPAEARMPAEDWIKKVEARGAALNASRRLVADALAAFGKSP